MKAATAIILAAGRGTRMNSAKPTALHEIAGRPVIDWMLTALERCTEERPVIVDGPERQIAAHVGERARVVVQQRPEGEADALRAARDALEAAGDRPVFVVYGCIPLADESLFYDMLADAAECGASKAILYLDEEITEAVDEKTGDVPLGMFCAPGIAWLAGLTCSEKATELNDCFDRGVKAVRSTAALTEGRNKQGTLCVPICNRMLLSGCEADAQEMLRERHMQNGVTMRNPESVYIGAEVEIGRDTVLWPNVVLTGRTVIGEGCVIKPGCQLNDTRVGNGCTLTSVVADRAVVGSNVKAGPFVNLRPDTRIADGCKIGDFVEVKNSNVGEGTKLPHLSYIGDADVGSGVNVGCGCVFVNYDGYAKHRTTVGNDVFLGCQTNLIAPVTVGDGAYTAAGSTITHDVPAGAMAFARARQSNKEGYVEKFRSLKKK